MFLRVGTCWLGVFQLKVGKKFGSVSVVVGFSIYMRTFRAQFCQVPPRPLVPRTPKRRRRRLDKKQACGVRRGKGPWRRRGREDLGFVLSATTGEISLIEVKNL
jgi:hypothetical protein